MENLLNIPLTLMQLKRLYKRINNTADDIELEAIAEWVEENGYQLIGKRRYNIGNSKVLGVRYYIVLQFF